MKKIYNLGASFSIILNLHVPVVLCKRKKLATKIGNSYSLESFQLCTFFTQSIWTDMPEQTVETRSDAAAECSI